MIKIVFVVALLFTPGLLLAQTSDGRGNVPPGTAADGSRPADGAIKGGSILPGERGGVPENAPTPERRIARCNELSGVLRDDCLLKEQNATTGGSREPDIYGPKSTPPTTPPPQNPR